MATLQSVFLPVRVYSSVSSGEAQALQHGCSKGLLSPPCSIPAFHCRTQSPSSGARSELNAESLAAESQPAVSISSAFQLSRREACLAAVGSCLAAISQVDRPAMAKGLGSVNVGSYLPKAGEGDFVVFSPGEKDTPALRAGNVVPYSFWLPPTWTQSRIANIQSGNYCQPKCAEPWIEVKFEDPRQGTLQVVASPMVRLTNKANQTIEEIGSPEKIISALGPFVTGDSYDPEELVEASVRRVGDQTYYDFTLETPYARSGSHNLAAATAKGSTVLLLVVSATDSQWAEHEKTLRKLIKSFTI